MKLLILYGSQTGTAADLAERLYEDAYQRYFEPEVWSLASYPTTNLPNETWVLFVVSTTGQGNAPDSMVPFWKFLLRKNLPSDSLAGLKFAVFGLGDSSYPRFNVVAKRLHRRLLQLGGNALVPCGNGDDQHEFGLEGALVPWLKLFWSATGTASSQIRDPEPWPKFEVSLTSTSPEGPSKRFSGLGPLGRCWDNPFLSTVLENRRLTAPDWEQDVRHLELSIDESMVYQPGDVVSILPQNPTSQVNLALEILRADGDSFLTSVRNLKPIKGPDLLPFYLPLPCRLRDLFTFHLDILGVPRLSFYRMLSRFATDPREKEKLTELISPSGQGQLLNYNYRAKRTYVEVLQQFPSAVPPLDFFLSYLPRLQPRQYSISSCLSVLPGRLSITLAIVKYQALYKRTKVGLFSSMLADSTSLDLPSLPIWVKTGTMSLPAPPTPVIMIGPGTGLAVFRSFLQEISQRSQPTTSVLFYGCRHETKDYLYPDELRQLASSGSLSHLFCAFSRDGPDPVYVQHKIRENKELLFHLVENGAVVYLSGNARRMPEDVREALVDVLRVGFTEEEAKERLLNMSNNGKFYQDTWY